MNKKDELINLFDYHKVVKNSRRIDDKPENNGYWNHQPLRDLNYDRAVIACNKGEQFTVIKKAVIADMNSIQFTDFQGLHLQSVKPDLFSREDFQVYTFEVPQNDEITHFNINLQKMINPTEEVMIFKGIHQIDKYEFIPYQPSAPSQDLQLNHEDGEGVTVFKNHDNFWDSYNFRIPSVIRTKKGTLLVFSDVRLYNGLDNYTIFNGCARSIDDGLTWTYQETMRNDAPNEEYARVMDATSVELPNGHIMVICGAWSSDEPWTNSLSSGGKLPKHDWDVKYVISEDDGQSWSPVSSLLHQVFGIPEQTVGWLGGVGTGIVMKGEKYKNRVIIPIQICIQTGEMNYSNPTQSGCIYSDDNGLTWTMSASFTDENNSENMIIEVDDTLIMSSRRDRRVGHRGSYISTDGGANWKIYEPLHAKMINGSTGNSGCQGSFIKYTAKNGHQVGLVSYPKTTKNDYTRDNITLYMYDFNALNPKLKELCIPYPGDACWYGGGYSSMALGNNTKGEESLCIVFEALEGIRFLDLSFVLELVEAEVSEFKSS